MRITVPDLLDKWEAPPINQVSKELEKLQKIIKQQEAAHNEFKYVATYLTMPYIYAYYTVE